MQIGGYFNIEEINIMQETTQSILSTKCLLTKL